MTFDRAFPPLKEAALWVAAASAAVYLVGSLYLGSYYAKFGVPEGEIDFSVPYVMSSSLLPFLLPAFWLALVAAACLAFSRRMPRPEGASAFFPIPGSKAAAYTFSLLALNTVMAAVAARMPVFSGWTTRGIVISLIGGLVFWITFRRAKRFHSAVPRPKLSPGTVSLSWLLSVAIGLGVLSMVMGKRTWPFGLLETSFLAGAVLFVAGSAAWELRKANRELAKTGEWAPTKMTANGSLISPAANIFLVIMAVLALLLHAGLSGTAAAGKILEGCQGTKTVIFEPPVAGVDNESMLVLHQDGRYYVRGNGTGLQIVTENPNLVATLGWRGPNKACSKGL